MSNLSVVPVHVKFVAVEDVRRLVDVLDGQPDCRHHAAADLALGGAGRHREEGGEVDVGPENRHIHFVFAAKGMFIEKKDSSKMTRRSTENYFPKNSIES